MFLDIWRKASLKKEEAEEGGGGKNEKVPTDRENLCQSIMPNCDIIQVLYVAVFGIQPNICRGHPSV